MPLAVSDNVRGVWYVAFLNFHRCEPPMVNRALRKLQIRAQGPERDGAPKRPSKQRRRSARGRAWSIQTLIDAFPASVTVLDHQGIIRYVNGAWRRFAKANGVPSTADGVGIKYLDLCRQAHLKDAGAARAVARKLTSLLKGSSSRFSQRCAGQPGATQPCCMVHGSRVTAPGDASVWILLTHQYFTPTPSMTEGLHDDDRRWKTLIESSPLIPWEADAKTRRIRYVGPQVAALLGYPPERWHEPGFWAAHLHPDDRESTLDRCRRLSTQVPRFELRYRMIARDGRPVWLLHLVTVVGPLTRLRSLRGFFLDVSAEADRHERDSLHRLLSEAIDEIFWFVRMDPERVCYISPAVESILGRKAEEFYGDARLWLTCVHEQDRARVEHAYAAWLADEAPHYREQYRAKMPDGSIRWLDDRGTLTRDETGRISFATGITKDITEQKHHEDMLRRLTTRLITAQEAERSRIARDLHDHVNQTLALLSVELAQFGRVTSSSPERQDALQVMQQRLKSLSSDIHAMSHRLHPSKLKHLGLVSAIRALCRDMEEGGLHVDFADHDIPRTLSHEIALTLYRVAQEGLHNVMKHSGTDSVELSIAGRSATITLRLRDKGKGFDPSLLDPSQGLGLVSMTERVSSVGGTLTIRSAPGAGTEIEASVPIQPESTTG